MAYSIKIFQKVSDDPYEKDVWEKWKSTSQIINSASENAAKPIIIIKESRVTCEKQTVIFYKDSFEEMDNEKANQDMPVTERNQMTRT